MKNHRRDSQDRNVLNARVEQEVKQGGDFIQNPRWKQNRTAALSLILHLRPQMLASKGWSVLYMKGLWVPCGRCVGKDMEI